MTFRQQYSDGIEYLERPAQDGPVLVLLHGVGSNAESFAPLLDHLPWDWRVIAWNAPGYGNSAVLDSAWPLASDYANVLKGFLDRLKLERILLTGHSLGCLIAAAFAAAHRDRVIRLLLSSPALGHCVPRGGTLSPAARARMDDLSMLGPEAFAIARAARLVHEPELNAKVVERVQLNMSHVNPVGYQQAVRMLASGRLLHDAERLRVPTEVIVGEEDVVTPPNSARRAHSALRPIWRGGLTFIPNAGHALYQQAPAEFASAVERWSRQQPEGLKERIEPCKRQYP